MWLPLPRLWQTNATLTPAAKKQQPEQSESVWYVAQKLLEKVDKGVI